MNIRTVFGLFVVLTIATRSQPAEASFHLWQFDQVYSNFTGSLQYVDFVLGSVFDDERFLAGQKLKAGLNSNTLTFANDLPDFPETGQHFLVATPGFAAIAGVTPDYTFPVAPFFNRNGDTLNYASVSTFTFPALPSDGFHARQRNGTTVFATPTNFTGQVGLVPEPATWVLLLIGTVALWAASRRGLRLLACSQRG
ncbi:MAG: PEP-CTERM sorting domain-containing protein [Planctomycetia bacterium]|nr:PEP-CTERM sorting domain-containing protein [Planctomycetia bacterium]